MLLSEHMTFSGVDGAILLIFMNITYRANSSFDLYKRIVHFDTMEPKCVFNDMRRQNARDINDTLVALKSLIWRIMDMTHAGNELQTQQAKIKLIRLMDMYRITLTENENEFDADAEEMYLVNVKTGYQSEASKLAQHMTALFSELVDVCRGHDNPTYIFYGHEPSTWMAANLFGEILNDQKMQAVPCSGFCMKPEEALPTVTTPLGDALLRVQNRGRTMLTAMATRMSLSQTKTKDGVCTIDIVAYQALEALFRTLNIDIKRLSA